jgi:hypothetical protein
MAKYLADLSGRMVEIQPVNTSAGAGDAGKIAQLDANGRWDVSMMPAGIGAEVTIVNAFENLTAGDFCNLFLDTAVCKSRKADATTNTKPAHGFTLAGVTAPASSTIYGISTKNTGLAGLTIGADYWLATTAGTVTTTAPSAAGNLVQELGTAESATAMVFSNVKTKWTKV